MDIDRGVKLPKEKGNEDVVMEESKVETLEGGTQNPEEENQKKSRRAQEIQQQSKKQKNEKRNEFFGHSEKEQRQKKQPLRWYEYPSSDEESVSDREMDVEPVIEYTGDPMESHKTMQKEEQMIERSEIKQLKIRNEQNMKVNVDRLKEQRQTEGVTQNEQHKERNEKGKITYKGINDKKTNDDEDTKRNEIVNRWLTDKRKNNVRFGLKETKGWWAKIRFECRGYHTEVNEKGHPILYTNKLELVRDVLKAIIRKGKLMDPTFTLLPRTVADERKIRNEEEIDKMVQENNRTTWLEGTVKRGIKEDGRTYELRKTMKEGQNTEMSIRFTAEKLDEKSIQLFCRDWQFMGRNEPNIYLYKNEVDESKQIRVYELNLRPVQESNVEEIAYILGSTSKFQDGMEELTNSIQKLIKDELGIEVKIGHDWTCPDIGISNLNQFWAASRREVDFRKRKTIEPHIRVLYMGMKNHTAKIRFEVVSLLLEKWGRYVISTNEAGKTVTNLHLLPGGNHGVLLPPYDTVRDKEDIQAFSALYQRHINNKRDHNSWIQTNISDMDFKIRVDKTEKSIREYLLSNQLVQGMYTFNGTIKYEDKWGEFPDRTYLVVNNIARDVAEKRLEMLTKEIIQKDPNAALAFMDSTIGPLTAFSEERNEPSRQLAKKFNLKQVLNDETARLRDIKIDGKHVIEIDNKDEQEKRNPWNYNDTRTYSTAQLTQSVVGMEISVQSGLEGIESNNRRERSVPVSQSPAIVDETQYDEDGFQKVRRKVDRDKKMAIQMNGNYSDSQKSQGTVR